MTGTTEKVDPPRNDAEWARDIQRRQDLGEHPDAVRCGQWTLWTNDTGDLVGSHVDGGSRVLAARPPDGVDPEAITESELPSVAVTRSALQSIPGAGAEIIWDGVVSEVGEWRTRSSAITVLQVPESGVYDISTSVWFQTGGAMLTTTLLVDGVGGRLGGRVYESAGASWLSVHACGQLYLTAGQAVSLFATAGATRNVGASTAFITPIPTALSLSMTSRG